MKNRYFLLLGLIIALGAAPAGAQLVTGRLTTSFYTLERFDTVGHSTSALRAYESMIFSVSQGNVSLHTSLTGTMNGTPDFGSLGYVRFYSLYVRVADIGKALDLSLGRQAVYAGVGNGTIDGVSGRIRLFNNGVTVSGYGGASVGAEMTGVRSNWHDNVNFGGQIVTTLVPNARIGVSYMNRHQQMDPWWAMRARDSATFSPSLIFFQPSAEFEQLGSVDAAYDAGACVSVYGRYDYDFNYRETSRGQFGARVGVLPALTLTGDVTYRKPRVAFNSLFSAFTSEPTTEVEAGAEYTLTPGYRAFLRVANVAYTDDYHARWSAGINGRYGSVSYSGSNGYAGRYTIINVEGVYPLLDRMLTPTVGVSYASYKLTRDTPRTSAFAVILGAAVRPWKALTFDLQGQWMNNELYNRDVRVQGKIMYWFAERLPFFSEEVK
jgi:hypothetical protein